MSRYFNKKYSNLIPYTPGEQPRDGVLVKLNTNESPFPPSPLAQKLAREAAGDLNLYSDPECLDLRNVAAEKLGVDPDELMFTNGSDEILNFAFMAYCSEDCPALFPDITYGFYSIFADQVGVPYRRIPLRENFVLSVDDYIGVPGTVVLANPNAPTCLALPLSEIERLVAANPERMVIIDEAYVDFGTESALKLIKKYPNLLVCRTFSKSYSLAGARLGFGAGDKALIADLNTLRYSSTPYNVNRMTIGAGIGALLDEDYFRGNLQRIIEARTFSMEQMRLRGFELTDSKTNFLFVRHPKISGKELFLELRKRGVLTRHFDTDLTRDYLRITVGTREQMDVLLAAVDNILEARA